MAKRQGSGKKPIDPDKQARKRARREERKKAEADARRRAERKRLLRRMAMGTAGAVVVGALGLVIVRKAVPPELPGVVKEANLGRTHVANGQTVPYGTATPTSGSHSASSARCGIFDQEIPAEFAVHSLEHGTVVIWYRPDVGDATVSALRQIVDGFDDRVILSPNRRLDAPVVATAWTRIKSYDGADTELSDFIDTYRNRAPESLRCAY